MKNFLKTIFIILLITNFKLNAQIDCSFSGYFVNLPIFQFNQQQISDIFKFKKNQFIDLNRLRLRPTIYLWEKGRINIEYEIDALYRNSTSGIFNFNISSDRGQIADLTWSPVNNENFSIIHFIDRLYFKQGFSWGEVVLGRQRISWGTGRIWNPTDLFNPINPATFYKIEKDGIDGISSKIFLGDFTDLNVVFNPNNKISKSNYGFRFRTNVFEYDFSIVSGRFSERTVFGFDLAGNLFDAGLRGEGIYSNKNNDNYVKYIIGLDYQFTSKLYALLEYHYNGAGSESKIPSDLTFFEKLLNGEILNLYRNYLNSSLSYLWSPLLTIYLSNNHNFNYSTGYVSLFGNYSFSENTYLTLGFQYTYGSEFTEYWYYPKSVYFQYEYYF